MGKLVRQTSSMLASETVSYRLHWLGRQNGWWRGMCTGASVRVDTCPKLSADTYLHNLKNSKSFMCYAYVILLEKNRRWCGVTYERHRELPSAKTF